MGISYPSVPKLVRLEDITDQVKSYNPSANLDIIWRAYVLSAQLHRGRNRLSGNPYLSHPLEVAYILSLLKMDEISIAVGLLHDTVEDTHTSLEEIREYFGNEVEELVDGVTKISKMEFATSERQQAENFRKLILATAKDIRVIIIKLADRLHNMRTLGYMPEDKQQRIAKETLEIYAPLANRLGIGGLKSELEDQSFKFLWPETYLELQSKLASGKEARESYVANIAEIIRKEIREIGIPGEMVGRPKHLLSIYQKMQRQGIEFERVYDLVGLRIITDSVRNCYAILGIIHSLWTPVPGRFKDYIALPKANMYQSLHTTVIGPKGERVEFQIRTEEMHHIAEEGIAAHWLYKEGGGKLKNEEQTFRWFRQMLDWQQDMRDAKEFMSYLKIDLFPDEIYVFTPKGDVKALPRGSTPIDFAYLVHTDIGHHCIGARVNNKMVPLRFQLRNGDTVEIITSEKQTPSQDWLSFVKGPRTKAKIKAWLKLAQKERSITLGREILEKELQKFGQDFSTVFKGKDQEEVAKRFAFQTFEDLVAAIGYGKLSAIQVIRSLIPEEVLEEEKKREESKLLKLVKQIGKKRSDSGVRVKGEGDILIRFAKCCNPVPGDRIRGFITRGRGVTVHNEDCPSMGVLGYDPDRTIPVEWDVQVKTSHPVHIRAITFDKPGILAKITSAIALLDVNISQARVITVESNKAQLDFTINILDVEHLQKVIRGIKDIKGVLRIERVANPVVVNTKRKKELGM